MAVAFVGAGSGAVATTGTGTVSKTLCTAGNLLLVHLLARGSTEDWSAFSNESNVQQLDGTLNNLQGVSTGQGVGTAGSSRESLFIGRVTADGTCSADFIVGASGEDLFCRMYEFSGASTATTIAGVIEQGAGTSDSWFGAGTSVASGVDVITNGADRLACVLVGLETNTTIGDFTGEGSGLNLTEAVAEFASATGSTATMQLQTGTIATAGTRSIGSVTIASTGWGVLFTSIIPQAAPTSQGGMRMMTLGLG